MTGTHASRTLLKVTTVAVASVLAVLLVVPMAGALAAEAVPFPAAAGESPEPTPSQDGSETADEDEGGRSWLGILIGTGLLGLAGWSLVRSSRGRSRFDDGFMTDEELRRNDPDMRHDDD